MTVRFCEWRLRIVPLSLLLLLMGCTRERELGPGPQFQRAYKELEERQRELVSGQASAPLLTLSAVNMPIQEFCRHVALQANVSIVVEASLDAQTISLDLHEQPAERALEAVARRLEVHLARVGSLFFLGATRAEDRGVLVRRVRRLGREELSEAIRTVLGETGRLYVGVDGLIVVGDRANVLARVDEMCDGIEDAPAVTWCVQLYLVSINEQNLADLGLDAKPALEVAYTFSAASAGLGRVGSPLGGRAELEGGLAAVLRAARESKGVHLLAEPLFVLVDGGSATFKNGETIPIVRRTENPQSGNVTTTGFDVFDTGLSVTCSVREMGQSAARCQVKVENSQIVDIVDGVPRTTREGLDSDVVMVSGGVYLVGSLHRQRREERQSGWLSLGRYTKESTDLVQVWARAYRVSEDILP